jgi:hypothetical protein
MPDMRTVMLALSTSYVLLLSGCGSTKAVVPQVATVSIQDFQLVRTYEFNCIVPDPQPQWNPDDDMVLVRWRGGFALLAEGHGNQQYFLSTDKRNIWRPVWINRMQFAYGPKKNVEVLPDARVVPSSEGLSVVSLRESETGKDYALTSKNLTSSGNLPRVWDKNLVAQLEDRIQIIDPFGKVSEFGPGFYAEPQRHGPGIAYLERPVLDVDYWSGATSKLGKLIIRWRPDLQSEVDNALEPRWTADGFIATTVLKHDPVSGQPWWDSGADIYLVRNATAKPELVATGAHSAAPNPRYSVLAGVTNHGDVMLYDYGAHAQRLIAHNASDPQWSHDGTRLLCQLPTEKDGECVLKVFVFDIGTPLTPAP